MVLDIITYALCRKNGGGGGGDNTHFIGTTTTVITDGATTNPITVDGESYTAVKGDIIIYDGTEFIFDGSAWQSFGGTMDTQPTQDSVKAVTSDGVYRYTAGQKEYVDGRLKGEIFNSYNQHDIGMVTVSKNQASGADSHAEGASTTASGSFSHAEGYGNIASGSYSHAEGRNNKANRTCSHAEGSGTTADGTYSHAEGYETNANGTYSHAEGYKTTAQDSYSHAEGSETTALSGYSHAEGLKTTARGQCSHVEGSQTIADGNYAHAEGYSAKANGNYSHAEGNDTLALGIASHAGGEHTTANTEASTVIGKYNVADGIKTSDPKHLFIIGNGTANNSRSNILEVSNTYLNLNGVFKQNGQVIDFSTLGNDVIEMSDIEYNTLATKDPDKVYFVYEAVEDNRTITAYDSNGDFMYTMTMYGCAASGISLNSKTTTPPTITAPDHFGSGAFIFEVTFEDGNTYYFSTLFTDGRTGYSISNNSAHVSDAYGSNLFFAINGNRFTLMSAPNVAWVSSIHIDGYDESSFELAITPKPNGFKRIYKGEELYATLNPTPIEEVSTITATTTEQSITFTEDCDYVWFRNLGDNDCYVSNHSNILIGADDVAIVKAGGGTRIAVPANKTVYIKSAQGTSVVEVHGQNSECAPFKPSGGTPNEYIKDATINSTTGSLTLTKKDGTTVVLTMDSAPTEDSVNSITSDGVYRHTAGQREYVNNALKGEIFNTYSGQLKNVASGDSSHAEGLSTTASGTGSHAEGGHTVASNEGSHAEGASTVASGQYSHAEGVRAEAIGFASHASGIHTIANTSASTVVGRYNVLDGTSENDPKHLLIVGNGTAFDSRSNILEVSDSYMNLNGTLKINNTAIGSLAMKDVDDIHREMSDVEYEALSNAQKNDGTEYFVYETSEDNRSIICKDANGNFKYKVFIYGVVSNGTPGWDKTATDADAPTTPPTKSDPVLYTSIMLGYTTSEKTTYFSVWESRVLTAYGKTTDKDASDCYYVLTDNPNSPYKLVTLDGEFGGNVAETLTTDIVTLGTKPTGNRYIKAYDKSYGDMSDLGALAYKDTASGTAVTTVGTLPSLTYDSTTESFTFSAGTLPTTGTVTVS